MIPQPTTSTMRACSADHPILSMTLSFFLGAAIGAGISLLVAPASGQDVRAGLAARARRARAQAADALARGRAAADRTRVLAGDERVRVSRAVDEGREALADMRARGERAVQVIGAEAAGAIADAKVAGREVRANLKRRGETPGVTA